MDPDKTFCLKWNNFQQNIFSTIRNLRLDLDFLDVTIYCKGKQLKAHKVILSACSNTFRAILKEAQSPHPVIVLWDVESRDVSALLDFMYNGQVDIQQDDLERFLIVADRLQVRGLSGEEPVSGPETADTPRKRALDPASALSPAFNPPTKVLRNDASHVQNSSSDHLVIHNHHPETREVAAAAEHHRLEIKTEQVEENNHKAHNNLVTLPHRSPAGPIKKRNLTTDREPLTNNHHVNNHRDAEDYTAETVDYPGEGGDYPLEQADNYDEFYEEDGGYNNSAQYPIDYSMDNSPGKSNKSVKCPYCDKVLKYRHNLKGHIQNQHGAGEPEAPCPICPDKIFKNSASLRDHMSRKHRAEKTASGAAVTAVTAVASPAASVSTAPGQT